MLLRRENQGVTSVEKLDGQYQEVNFTNLSRARPIGMVTNSYYGVFL